MTHHLLLVRAGNRLCGLSTDYVEETMRALPMESIREAPHYVRGVAIVRGEPTPVVDLGALLEADISAEAARMVTLKPGEDRRVAVLVHEVLGVLDRNLVPISAVAPLLRDAAGAVVEEMARLDGELLTILKASTLIPADVLEQLANIEVEQ